MRSCRLTILSPCAALAVALAASFAAGFACRGEQILQLTITRSGAGALISWTNSGAVLESALTVTGVWCEVVGAVSPYPAQATNAASFFRLRQEAAPADFAFRYAAPEFTTGIGDPPGCGCTSPENPNSLAAGGSSQDNALGSVLLHTGELTQHAIDLEIPGRGLNWRFERRYRSGMEYDGPLGHNWDFSHNRRLAVETNGNVLCMDGLGRADRYAANTNGTFDAPSGIYARLKRNLDGTFEERDRHGMTHFYSATNALGIARLTAISDRNGNQMLFQYNAFGQLTNVVDTLNRSIAYSYDGLGRLTNVMDFTGRALRYSYDADGNLVSARSPTVVGTPNGNDFPNGKTTAYTYLSGCPDARFNHNLLIVTAPNEVAVGGPARLAAQYDTASASPNADRLLSLRLGGTNSSGVAAGGTLNYGYATLGAAGSNDFITAIFQTTVTNRNGNVAEYRFNQQGNIVRISQFTRGFRLGDPAGYTNLFAFNRDGERISRTNAELDSIQYTFNASHPDRLQQGNLLQIVLQPGPRGSDQAQILTSMTYETNFNFVKTATDGRGNITSYAYDSNGNRTNVIHRIGSIVEDFEYNSFGQPTAHVLPDNGSGHRCRDEMTYYSTGPQTGYLQSRIVDSGGFNLTTTYQYDAVGNVVRVIDPRGKDWTNVFNELNQIVRKVSRPVATPTNGLVRYQTDRFYDANDNLLRVDTQNRDDSGAVVSGNPAFSTSYTFDILNDRLSTADEVDSGHNVSTGHAYDANQNPVLIRFGEAAAGNQTNNSLQTLYDERDLVLKEIRAPGSSDQSTVQSDYDGDGNRIRVSQGTEDTSGTRVTTYAYDGYNRRTSITDAMGNVTSQHYDANGNLVAQNVDGELTDVSGSAGNTNLAQTTYTYDAMDRLVQTDSALFDTTTHTNIGTGHAVMVTVYSANSQVRTNFDANANPLFTTYDTANRPSTVTDAKGNTRAFTYDANGNLVATTQTDKSDLGSPDQSFTTVSTFDGLDRLISLSDNETNTVSYLYDSRDNRTLVVDPLGNQTRYTYDGLNRLLQTSRDMNTNGVFTDPGDISTSQTWDDSSRIVSRTDANGYSTMYAYDGLDRLISTVMADGTGQTNTYDSHDNRTRSQEATGTQVDSVYDLLNRLTTNQVTRGSGVLGTTNETYQYDGLSRLVRAQDDDSTVTRAYDSLSRATTETQQLSGTSVRTVTAAFDAAGNQTQLTYPGGRVIGRAFDALNRPSVVQQTSPSSAAIATYQYLGPSRVEQRDYGNGTRTVWQYDGVTGAPNAANDFGVMRAARITHTNATAGGLIDDRTCSWDRDGNLNSMNDALLPDTRTYSYDAIDRLVTSISLAQTKTNRYFLDSAGNRASVSSNGVSAAYTCNSSFPEPADCQVNQYTGTPFDAGRGYDRNGNVTNVLYANGVRRTLSYDYRNQLVQINDSDLGTFAQYQYDCFGRRINKLAHGVATRYYFDGGQEIEERNAAGTVLATYVYSKGFASRLQLQRNLTNYFYHEDYLGSVVKVTDPGGLIVEAARYEDYGQPILPEASAYSQSPNQVSGYVSDLDASPFPSATNRADNLSLTLPITVTSLKWWGSYLGTLPTSDNFTITVFTNSGGLPGSAVSTFTITSNRLTRTTTGLTVSGSPEFLYTLTLPTAQLTLPSGSYFLAIANNVTGTSAWKWESGSGGNGLSAVRVGAGPWSLSTGTDTAYLLGGTTNAVDGNSFLYGGALFSSEIRAYAAGGIYYDSDIGRRVGGGHAFKGLMADEAPPGNNPVRPAATPLSDDGFSDPRGLHVHDWRKWKPNPWDPWVPWTPPPDSAPAGPGPVSTPPGGKPPTVPPNQPGSPAIAKPKCCPEKLRITVDPTAHGDATKTYWVVYITATFKDKPPPCKCECCEYRQYVRGSMTVNGSDASPAPSLGGARLNPNEEIEDYAWVSNDDAHRSEEHRYGHRTRPDGSANPGVPGQDEYCDHGCKYKGRDKPFVGGVVGKNATIDLHFRGEIIDVCNDGVVAKGPVRWDIPPK